MEVSWKAIDGFDNLDNHSDPWITPPFINGKRIFPDSRNPDESTLRNKVEVVVKTSPSLVGKTVKVKTFDIDDSTNETFDRQDPYIPTSAAIIDTNDKVGNDNILDYLSTPCTGQFISSGTVDHETAVGTVDANGETKFTLKIGMQPGSNYKVVVTEVDGLTFPDAQVVDSSLDTYLGPNASQTSKAPSSPMLTVWRKLWVENDSMGEVEIDGTVTGIPVDDYGSKLNDLHQTHQPPLVSSIFYDSTTDLTRFQIPHPKDLDSFLDLEHGRLKIIGEFHPVNNISTVINYDPFHGYQNDYFVYVKGDHSSIPANSGFRLYDDDDFGLTVIFPYNSLVDSTIKNVYKPAFIDVVDASIYNETMILDFHVNHPMLTNLGLSYGVWDDSLDSKLNGKESLWTTTVICGYQDEEAADGDPGSEGASEGVTPVRMYYGQTIAGGAKISIIWLEDIRDGMDTSATSSDNRSELPSFQNEYINRIKLTAAHEIGHQPRYLLGEDHHNEGGLMQEGGSFSGDPDGSDSKFKPESILRFRKVHEWVTQ